MATVTQERGYGGASLTADGRRIKVKLRQLIDARPCCRNCGCEIDDTSGSATKRGAVVVRRDPLVVQWNGRTVPLSPTEALIFSVIFFRGRASFELIGETMIDAGMSPENRSVLMWRIKRKFAALGADNPFEPLSNIGIKFLPEPDQYGSVATMIGVKVSKDVF